MRYNICFELLRYATYSYLNLIAFFTTFWPDEPKICDLPSKVYFLSDEHEYDETYTTVPENAVYVEEWTYLGRKLCRVLYEGEDIPRDYRNPFDESPAKRPWIWVGDRTTEIDLTKTFDRFLVPGNRIELDLVLKLIHITEESNLQYIENGTFAELKFPGDGIVIEADDDVPVPDS